MFKIDPQITHSHRPILTATTNDDDDDDSDTDSAADDDHGCANDDDDDDDAVFNIKYCTLRSFVYKASLQRSAGHWMELPWVKKALIN